MSRSARVIIASTRAAAGVYEDRTGPVIIEWLTQRGYAVPPPVVGCANRIEPIVKRFSQRDLVRGPFA